jgi:hypothetical protein
MAFSTALFIGSSYSGGQAPRSGFYDWPAQQKTTKKNACIDHSLSTVPNYTLALLMMITTPNCKCGVR